MNYVDIIIAVILGIGFVKGFMKGFWSSVLAVTGTVIGLVGAYFLTGPVVGYLEQTAGLVTQLSQKWADVFSLFPNYSKPYDPNSVAEFFQGIDSIEWLRPMSALIKDHFLQVEAIAGPGATWGQILPLLISQILVASIVFLLLIILLRLLWSLVARTFSMITSMSLANRFLGGILQLCLSAMWMALIVGILYPFVGLGVFKPVGEMLATSRLVAVLIGIYKAMLPPALARIVPRM
ncbi:MAG TPA: CvpA family protein [Bacillota bacterium]|nr:CvpA family protein [Candidatus Fermentithermobacillaceae bacterium]HOB30747.1 CvpA family protein [Bacillota bacterium]HOK64868.1 CvpA family protein [Bacillota bacterium]HOL12589.1 CvpA family protein [Bacillota bacterium]HOQ03311.1 CvpA family protein [Bacillota bacterium]